MASGLKTLGVELTKLICTIKVNGASYNFKVDAPQDEYNALIPGLIDAVSTAIGSTIVEKKDEKRKTSHGFVTWEQIVGGKQND